MELELTTKEIERLLNLPNDQIQKNAKRMIKEAKKLKIKWIGYHD